MVRSIFLITEYGGEYEDSWERTRNFGFLTFEEAEQQLLKKGWKKQVYWNGTNISYENPYPDHWSYSPYYARIHEHKFYDKEATK